MKKLLTLALASLCLACGNLQKEIVLEKDYQPYLINTPNTKLNQAKEELSFWTKKYEAAPNQVPYLSKIAAAEGSIFENTGDVNYLISAGNHLEEAVEMSNRQSAGILRSLSRNYISQHKFKEAKSVLMEAFELGENKNATEKMIFDVALELGEYDLAKEKLNAIADEGDFDYLIRLAKWEDTSGNLEEAIFDLELALQKAEELKSEELKLWAFSNIADFYGHNGEIEKSYKHYLKALEINPHYYYSLKGIAWIAFSHEKNANKANSILDYIITNHQAPDYHLLKAEIAAFEGNEEVEASQKAQFYAKLKAHDYGDMYNKYLVLENPAESLSIAKKEIDNRPTPESYNLYAWALLNTGDKEEALSIAQEFIEGKTSEPEAYFHLAQIYKANGLFGDVDSLKSMLMESTYELGPNSISKIKSL